MSALMEMEVEVPKVSPVSVYDAWKVLTVVGTRWGDWLYWIQYWTEVMYEEGG